MKNRETAFIYCRVSTDKQETERQLQDLREYCAKNKFQIIEEYQETMSGTKSMRHREKLLQTVASKKPDFFVFHDYSRFSRNVKTALMLKDELHDLGVCLLSMQTNMRSLDEDGTPNPVANLVFTQLLSVYEMENETRRNAIKSGLKNARRKGVVLGIPKGTKESRLEKYPKIVKLFIEQEEKRSNGERYLSMRKMEAYTGVYKSVLQNIKTEMRNRGVI